MYASKSTVTMAVIAGLLLSSPAVFAQNAGAGAGAGSQAQSRVGSGTRLQDQGRLGTRDLDRLHDRTQDRTQDRLHDRLTDRLYERDLRRERDRDRIYGAGVMTQAEQAQYEQRLRSLPSEQERIQYRMEHQHEMQQRAEERHERLGRAPSGSQIRAEERQRQREREQIYGYSMMTPEEVARYQAQMGAARSSQERDRIRAEHHQQMEQRTRERSAAPPQ